MNDVLTIEEIESRFDSEWVLIGNPKTDKTQRVLSGRLLAHSCNRDDVDRCLLALRPRHYAMWYTGKLPDDMAVVLLGLDFFRRGRLEIDFRKGFVQLAA